MNISKAHTIALGSLHSFLTRIAGRERRTPLGGFPASTFIQPRKQSCSGFTESFRRGVCASGIQEAARRMIENTMTYSSRRGRQVYVIVATFALKSLPASIAIVVRGNGMENKTAE